MQTNKQEKLTDKDRLFSRIRNEKVTLFIGSGFSLSAGAPTARDIVNAIKAECPLIEQTELKDVAKDFVLRNNEDRDKLIKLVQSLFPMPSKCDNNQKTLTRLPHFKQIFTTNYDSYIEDAYADGCNVIREEKDLVGCTDNKVQIYKLHGDFVNQDALVITQDDYDDFFDHRKNSLIWAPLKLAMMNTHVVFIGYSLDDNNVYRIIQNIESICGTSPREMYMVTPSTEEYKAERLKKHNVTWIKDYAENFLQELEQLIKDTICDDYRKKKVSHQTFINFCHLHDINPDIRENEKNNEVVKMQGYRGKALNRQISIRATYDPLANFNLEKTGPIMEDGPLKGKYAITVPKTDISSFECRVNGIKEFGKEDIQNLYLMPLPRIVPVKIRIPNRNFIGAVDCSILLMSPTAYSCTFDFDICSLVITITRNDSGDLYLTNIHVETNDIYKSQENAMRWIEVIDAIFSGEQILIPELNGLQLKINEKQEHPFKWYKKYYEFVQTIELKSSISFSQYQNLTPDRYDAAEKLYHWLTQQEIYHLTPKGGPEITFEYTNEIDSNELLNTSPTHRWGMAYQEFLTSTPMFQEYENQDMITVRVHDLNNSMINR